jgi:tetratricopeptide (TPR) repeat protein
LFNDVILQLPSNTKAKQQMIDACREYYRGNEKQLASIDEFKNTYTSDNCIRWYTRETFVYKMINKALRTEDVQQLDTFRFYISDLSLALAQEHKNNKLEESDDELITILYRGVRLTLTELEQFRSNEGKLISINGYLSTTRLHNVAVMFAKDDIKRADSVPVLFEIKCQKGESDYPIYADIAKFSNFPNEQEVLFDLGAVFIVDTVGNENDMWKICMNTTDGGREIAKQYIEETKKEMHGDSVVIVFGSLLTRTGHYHRAETYFQQLLNDPGNENLAHIHNQLGLVYQAKGEFSEAIFHFDIAYRLLKKSSPPLLRDSAHVLLNMSYVLLEQGHYRNALECCSKAKYILDQLDDSCQLEMARCLHNIGSSYRGQRKYDEALAHYEDAVNIQRACLPENHVHIAETLNSIGLVYLMSKDIEKAFNFYLSSLEMYQTCLPEDHPDIANVLHNIAEYFQLKAQHDKALQHYHLALAMKEKCFPPDHPSIAATLNNISTVLSAKGEKEKALQLCLKALSMRERLLPSDHPDLALSLSSAGHKYEAMKEYQRALRYFEKALEIRAKFLPEDDPIRKRTERHVIRMKRKAT